MKLITHKNYIQQKHWLQASLHKMVCDEDAKMTDEEHEASKQRQAESLNRLKAQLNEHMASSHYEPLHFRRWLFSIASKKALQVAKDYSLDVYIEHSEENCRIRFITDQLISEAEWMDSKEKRSLLRLMKWADSVWIDTIVESDMRLVQISLTDEISKLVPNK